MELKMIGIGVLALRSAGKLVSVLGRWDAYSWGHGEGAVMGDNKAREVRGGSMWGRVIDHLVLMVEYAGEALDAGETYQEHAEAHGSPFFHCSLGLSEYRSEHWDPRLEGHWNSRLGCIPRSPSLLTHLQLAIQLNCCFLQPQVSVWFTKPSWETLR